MNTPQNYEAILQRIQQEIEGLKGFQAKLSLKNTRLDLLVAQLKETRTELEATQTKLEATQRELGNTQTRLQKIEAELRSTQMVSPKDGMEMIYVPAGKFLMGSYNNDPDANDNEKPQHEVYLDPYWIDKTPVTNAMFAKFVAETGYVTEAEKAGSAVGWTGSKWGEIKGAQWRHPRGPNSNILDKENHPVVSVSWNDAVAYATWAGRRLPTEAEWEKAAGGTDGRQYPWGNNRPTPELANIYEDGIRKITPVGNYPAGASPYGALDMAGNVWEWCHDTYAPNYYASSSKTNPQGPQQLSKSKVVHGGAWTSPSRNCRTRYRDGSDANSRRERTGFRCGRSLF